MAFPISPADGSTTIVNGIGYVYSSSTNAWSRAISPVANLTVSGNVFSERVYTTSGLYWAGNNLAFTGANGLSFISSVTAPEYPALGDQWYASDIGILFEYLDDGDSQQWVDINSPVIAANASINLSVGDLSLLGHFTPGINQTYDLGNLNYKWRSIYIDGVTTTGNITSTYGLFWANGKPAVYSNTAVAQYLPTYTGNLAAGNITTTSGLFWANGSSAIGPVYGNTQVAQYLSTYTGNLAAGNIATTSSITVGANLTVTQSGLFRGAYNENSTLSGVFVGNTGTGGGITPRVGFFNGNTQQNWQIDNFGGAFRWFVPGASKMTLYDTGNLNVTGSYTIGGKRAVNGPAFSAYASAVLQTITSGSQQKVLFQTEEFDTDNCYASSRFTPNVEGYYQLNAEVRLDGASGTGEMMIVLYRNGAEYKRGWNQQGTQIAANFWAMTVSSLVYANGTTDFFEIYVQQGSGSSVTVTAVDSPNITWFNGAMVRGA